MGPAAQSADNQEILESIPQKGAVPAQGESEKHRANRASCLSLGVGFDAVATARTQEISRSRLKPAATGTFLLPFERFRLLPLTPQARRF